MPRNPEHEARKTQPETGKVAPAAVRVYLRSVMAKLLGQPPPVFTENDFTDEELQVIRDLREFRESEKPEDAWGRAEYGFNPRQVTNYDWMKTFPGFEPLTQKSMIGALDDVFTDPRMSMYYTLGRFGMEGDRSWDRYDMMYSRTQPLNWPNLTSDSGIYWPEKIAAALGLAYDDENLPEIDIRLDNAKRP
jgi:hypothetical protein